MLLNDAREKKMMQEIGLDVRLDMGESWRSWSGKIVFGNIFRS